MQTYEGTGFFNNNKNLADPYIYDVATEITTPDTQTIRTHACKDESQLTPIVGTMLGPSGTFILKHVMTPR